MSFKTSKPAGTIQWVSGGPYSQHYTGRMQAVTSTGRLLFLSSNGAGSQFTLRHSGNFGGAWATGFTLSGVPTNNPSANDTHPSTQLPMTIGPRASMAVDASDNVWIAVITGTSEVLRVYRFNNTGSSSWASSASLTLTRNLTGHHSRVDIDCLDSGAVAIATVSRVQESNQTRATLFTIPTSQSAIGEATQVSLSALRSNATQQNSIKAAFISIARDAGGASGGEQKVALSANAGAGTRVWLGTTSVNLSTGEASPVHSISHNVGHHSASDWFRVHLFSMDDDEWYFAAGLGAGGSSRCQVASFNSNDFIVQPTDFLLPSGKSFFQGQGNYTLARSAVASPGVIGFYYSTQATNSQWFCHLMVAKLDASGVTWVGPQRAGRMPGPHYSQIRDFHGTGHNRNLDKCIVPCVFQTIIGGGQHQVECITNSDTPNDSLWDIFFWDAQITAPGEGDVVDTNRPQFALRNEAPYAREGIWSALLQTVDLVSAPPLQARVQVATNSSITENVRDFVFSSNEYLQPGGSGVVETVPPAQQLFQDEWYFRFRERDIFGLEYQDWRTTGPTGPAKFTVSHPPRAINMRPGEWEHLTWSEDPIRLSWDFFSSWEEDFQEGQALTLGVVGAGSIIGPLDYIETEDTFRDVVIDEQYVTGVENPLFAWAVQLRDSEGVDGQEADWAYFHLNKAPEAAFTSDPEITSPRPEFTWSYEPGTGGDQVRSRILITLAGLPHEVVYDSGFRLNVDHSWQVPFSAIERSTHYDVHLFARDGNGIIGYDVQENVLAQWVPPDVPASLIQHSKDFHPDIDGAVAISVDTTQLDPAFDSIRIYRREVSPTTSDWTLIRQFEENSDDSYTHLDWTAPTGTQLEYAIVQVILLNDAPIESDREPVPFVFNSDTYYLIDQQFQGLNVDEYLQIEKPLIFRLEHVTGDTFTDEYEEEVHVLMGRGRKRDVGQNLGVEGVLEAELRGIGGMDPVLERHELERFRKQNVRMYLRNPFGEMRAVSLGQLEFDRTPGVGQLAAVTVTIPYYEVVEDA